MFYWSGCSQTIESQFSLLIYLLKAINSFFPQLLFFLSLFLFCAQLCLQVSDWTPVDRVFLEYVRQWLFWTLLQPLDRPLPLPPVEISSASALNCSAPQPSATEAFRKNSAFKFYFQEKWMWVQNKFQEIFENQFNDYIYLHLDLPSSNNL